MAIKIVYEDIAVGVEGNVTNTTNSKQDFVNMNDIDKSELNLINYATLEYNRWRLTDDVKVMPDRLSEDDEFGYWSLALSDANGHFATPPAITRTYTSTFTSTGITLKFDTLNNVYANDVNIKWYRNSTLLSEKNFTPNSVEYFCQNIVTAYNKIVITFNGTNVPYRFVRVEKIVDGITRYFYKDEISNLEIFENISDTGEDLAINTMNLELISKSPVKMLFQKVQALNIYNNDNLFGTFFVENATREMNKYNLTTYDLVGMLDNSNFVGGMYSNYSATTLINDIVGEIPVIIDSSLNSKTITGYLPISTSRDALLQVAFSINAIVDTSRNDAIRIYEQPSANNIKTIGVDRMGTSVTENSDAPCTAIQLNEHKYNLLSDTTELYNDALNGTITITFSEPIANLTITGGTINASGTNYATITGTGGNVTLSGNAYEDVVTTKTIYNPQNTASSIPNVHTIENATLVNSSNSTTILNRLENVLFSNNTYQFSFLMHDEVVGDYVSIATDEGEKIGQIISIDYQLLGNTIWSNCEMREVAIDGD